MTVRMSVETAALAASDDGAARPSNQKTGMISVGDFLEKSTSDKEKFLSSITHTHTHTHTYTYTLKYSDSKNLLTFTFEQGEWKKERCLLYPKWTPSALF